MTIPQQQLNADDAALNEVLGEVMGPQYADPTVVVDDRKHYGRFARTSNDAGMDRRDNKAPEGQGGVSSTAGESAAQRARRLFGLDSSNSLVQAYDVDGNKVDNQFFIRHDDSGTFTTTRSVSGNYGLLQPDCLDLIEVAAPGVDIDRGFSWNNHQQIGLQSCVGKFVGPTGLSYESRATILQDYTGCKSLQLWLTAVCLACQNQKAMSWRKAKYKWKLNHTARVGQRVADLRIAFSHAGEQQRKMQGYLFEMDKIKISTDDVAKMVAEWLPKKKDKQGKDTNVLTKQAKDRHSATMNAYHTAEGAVAPVRGIGSLYGVVQAGTFMSSNYFSGVRAGLQGITSGVGYSFAQSMYESVNTRYQQETGGDINKAIEQHGLVHRV